MRRGLIVAIALAGHCAAQQGAEGLKWMAGCWAGTSGALTFEEQWTRPVGGMLLGSARTIKQGRVVFHEFMRVEDKEGKLTFTPRIGSAAKTVVFTRIRQAAGEVVFENAGHDFPQRVVYRSTPDGLLGRVEGTENGKARAEDFPMKRVPCE